MARLALECFHFQGSPVVQVRHGIDLPLRWYHVAYGEAPGHFPACSSGFVSSSDWAICIHMREVRNNLLIFANFGSRMSSRVIVSCDKSSTSFSYDLERSGRLQENTRRLRGSSRRLQETPGGCREASGPPQELRKQVQKR